MYLAKTKINNKIHYIIRESYRSRHSYCSRDLFDLGCDPTRFIHYPGGHGYYYDECIEDALSEKGVTRKRDDLDKIFWNFLDPEIQRVISGFQKRRYNKAAAEENPDPRRIHMFDKRRVHYLKFAQLDQKNIHRAPPKVFRTVWNKSRDEIEQYFIREERLLRQTERAQYIYVIFDLQRFFENPLLKTMPAAIQQRELDRHFTDAVCELNRDEIFWGDLHSSHDLNDYLKKYVIMYFDNVFPRPTPLQDYLRDFTNRHRMYRPPEKIRIKKEQAAHLFGHSWKALKEMNRRELTRVYRKLILTHHPDQGGKSETFIQITEIYQVLLKGKT